MKVGTTPLVLAPYNVDASIDQVRALAGKHAELLSALNHTVKRFLDENARRWVDMQHLFSFMKIS